MDYIPVSKTLYFSPGVQTQTVNIVILDDLGQPAREGLEYFELGLVLPINARVAVPERALVVINDTHSDCKYMFTFISQSAFPKLQISFQILEVDMYMYLKNRISEIAFRCDVFEI